MCGVLVYRISFRYCSENCRRVSASARNAKKRRQPKRCQMAHRSVPKFGTHFFSPVVNTNFFLLYPYRIINGNSIVSICVCHKKAGPLDTFLNKLRSRVNLCRHSIFNIWYRLDLISRYGQSDIFCHFWTRSFWIRARIMRKAKHKRLTFFWHVKVFLIFFSKGNYLSSSFFSNTKYEIF